MGRATSIRFLFCIASFASYEAFAFRQVATTRSSFQLNPKVQTDDLYTSLRCGRRLSKEKVVPERNNRNNRSNRMYGSKALKASPLLLTVASPIGSIVVLASIVLIHECGHYFAAKSFGIKVEEFSVGVGPKLIGFSAFGNSFNLRALPLGGYVRFPENFNTTLVRQIEIEEEAAFSDYIRQKELGLGVQLLNAITLGAVVNKIWGDEKERRKQEKISQELQKKKSWWQQFSSTSSANDPSLNEIEYYDDPTLLQNRPWPERAVVISGGVIFNLLLAFVIYFGQISFGPGLPLPVFGEGIVVTANPRPDVAASGLIQKGDVIVGINNLPVTSTQTPSAIESSRAVSDFVSTIQNTPNGERVTLEVLRRGTTPLEVVIEPKRVSSDSGTPTIGVMLSPNYLKTTLIKSESPIEAAGYAYEYARDLTIETAQGLLQFFGILVTGSGNGGSNNQISGPLGLIRTGSEIVATQDFSTVLMFAAAISVNLGVVNALPIPALDGGQMLFILAEAVTGRKVDQRFEETVTGVAFLFLILLTFSTFFGDLSAIILGS